MNILSPKGKNVLCFRRRSYPARIENENKGIRFAVRSLGWVEICEDDLTPERSSKAVNKCIVDLSLGRNDFIDNVGRWGDVSTNHFQFYFKLISKISGKRSFYGFGRRSIEINRSRESHCIEYTTYTYN